MASSKKRKIAILSGGPSEEHEVSVNSAKKVLGALNAEKYDAEHIYIQKTGAWHKHPEDVARDNDVAFIVMHGTYGEDGTIQRILDSHAIPYTGSNAFTSALAMNKYLSSSVLARNGIAIPLTFLITKNEWEGARQGVIDKIKHYLSYPFVVKPNMQGSSVGVHIIKTRAELEHAMYDVFRYGNEAIIQKFIAGVELSCGVLDHGWRGSEYALPPIEIIPNNGTFFDYSSKYVPMGSEEIIPARFPDYKLREIQRIAVAVHKILGARGMSRTDMIMDRTGRIYVLELNTIPGMTEESLLPKSAEVAGISFEKLLDLIIASALSGEK